MRKFYTSILFIVFLFTSISSFSQIIANDDNITTSSGFSSTIVLNVTPNDTFNGSPVTASNTDVTPVTNGPILIDANGVLTLAPNTPYGTYSATYQLCNIGNTDCDTAIATVNVFNPIVAVNDSFPPIPSIPNLSILGNVTGNDTLNGNPVTFPNSDVTPVTTGPLSIDPNGTLTVAPNTPPGTYVIVYQICETGAIPANCDTGIVTVVVVPSGSVIIANDDTTTISNVTQNQIVLQDILANDTLNGIPVTLSTITLSQTSSTSSFFNIQNNGSVIATSSSVPNGTYVLNYQICQISAPNNCDIANVVIIVSSPLPVIIANDDTTNVSNVTQNQIVLQDILANDTLNGIPVTLNNVTISSLSSTSSFFTIQPNGSVIATASNVPNGGYTLNYQICQNNAPNNCDSAFVIINVNNDLNTTINGTYVDFNNDGFTNVGDIINYTFIVTNNASSAVTNINLTNGANAPVIIDISGGPLPNLSSGTSDTTTFTGTYVLTQSDITNGFVSTFINTTGTLNGSSLNYYDYNTTNLNISNGIRLNAFLDTNGNGVQNSGEQSFNYGNFTYQINNGTISTLSSTNNGVILYESNPSNSYNITFSVYPFYASQYTVAPATYSNITVANNSAITTYNFPVTVNPYNDLVVYLEPTGGPRPGFIYANRILYRNQGNQTIASGTVTFNVNNVVSISTYPSGAITNAAGFTYPFTNLLPYESRYIYVYFQVPTIPTVNIGQLLTNSASITIPVGDINTANNASSLTQDIRSSYDPNDKQESHGGKILHSTFTSNDYLTYTIQFENTGNAEAVNIRVNDVLDSKLNETSIRMISASDPYVLQRVGNVLNWKFNGINLPPSNGSATIGHGYITFQIKPKPGYAIGDIIPNFASIYFDFNPAIVTETCNTEFVAALSNENFAFTNFNFYPNPIKDNLKISNNSVIDSVEILSLLGQKMIAKNVNALETELNLSELSSGIYFVKVVSDGQAKVVKIVKE